MYIIIPPKKKKLSKMLIRWCPLCQCCGKSESKKRKQLITGRDVKVSNTAQNTGLGVF